MTTIKKTSISINGQNYNSVEDVPNEFKDLVTDSDGNGIPDKFDAMIADVKKQETSTDVTTIQSTTSPQPITLTDSINKKALIILVLVLFIIGYFIVSNLN